MQRTRFVAVAILVVFSSIVGCEREPRSDSRQAGAAQPKADSGQQPPIRLPAVDGIDYQKRIDDGDTVDITVTREKSHGGVAETHREASGQGAGFRGAMENGGADFNAQAPTSQLDGDMASGGGFAAKFTFNSPWPRIILAVFGVLTCLLAAWQFYRKNIYAAIVCGLVGAGMIAVALKPDLIVWVLLGLVAVAVFFILRSDELRRKFFEAGRAMAGGVEEIKDDKIRHYVKSLIGSQAVAEDEATISKLKAFDKLPTESERRKVAGVPVVIAAPVTPVQ